MVLHFEKTCISTGFPARLTAPKGEKSHRGVENPESQVWSCFSFLKQAKRELTMKKPLHMCCHWYLPFVGPSVKSSALKSGDLGQVSSSSLQFIRL